MDFEELPGDPAWHSLVRVFSLMLVLFVAVIVFGTVYYFNRFVMAEQNCQTALAQIDKELQRRTDLVRNLLPAVFEYADLERHIFTEVSRVRAHTADTAPKNTLEELVESFGQTGSLPPLEKLAGIDPGAVGEMLAQVSAVAEQYPNMKSSAPFQMLMERLVDIEDRIAMERKSYNDFVNLYTTLIDSFPGYAYAKMFGFEPMPLFSAQAGADQAPQVGRPEQMGDNPATPRR